MKQDLHELKTVLKHQSARRTHRRRGRQEGAIADALAKASERTEAAAQKHGTTRAQVKGLFG